MTTSRLPVTVTIPVKNEELNLARCLSKLSRFAEVVVVDSSSTDRTQAIAREHGARLINFEWNGSYPKKRNWFLLNQEIRTPWVLFLDADEIVDEAFCDELAKVLADDDVDGYWLNYTNYFVGKPLRHGDRQRKLALFRAGKGLYERIDERSWSGLDMEVHEHPIIQGRVGEIVARIDHNDDRGLLKFIDRHRDYAAWEARRFEALASADVSTWRELTDRQRKKYRNINRWWFAPAYFAATYIGKAGLLDGGRGLAYAFFKLWYFVSIRLIISERRRPKGVSSPSPALNTDAREPQKVLSGH